MRCRFAVLALFAVLPGIDVWAAPAPPPSAILEIEPPPKGKTAEEHRQDEIGHLMFPQGMLHNVWRDPEVSKLPSVARREDPRPWLSENLEVTPVLGKDRFLRLRFRVGSTAEQVAILNSLLRVYLRANNERLQWHEKIIREDEERILELIKRIKAGQQPRMTEAYRKGINDLRSISIPNRRAEVARLSQATVIRWAK